MFAWSDLPPLTEPLREVQIAAPPKEPKLVTPGWNASRPTMLRANIGISMIAWFAMALPSDASVVFTCSAAASTVDLSAWWRPTFSKVIGTVAGWLTSSFRSLTDRRRRIPARFRDQPVRCPASTCDMV